MQWLMNAPLHPDNKQFLKERQLSLIYQVFAVAAVTGIELRTVWMRVYLLHHLLLLLVPLVGKSAQRELANSKLPRWTEVSYF